MTKKRKIILISLAVTLALAVGVGGLVYANYGLGPHEDVGGNKLLGVGEMGEYICDVQWGQVELWDTHFIITNPNCEQELTIEWVALIAGEDVCYDFDGGPCWEAEEVIFEGTPDDWYSYFDIEIPGNMGSVRGVLSPHEVWQVGIAELVREVLGIDPYVYFISDCDLGKYTLEVTWSGARYTGWWWWGYWRSGRPLTGWQKERCMSMPPWGDPSMSSFAISEAPMELFHSRKLFSPPDWWHLE